MSNLDLRARNIGKIFAILDTDADGFIASDDLTAIGAGVDQQVALAGFARLDVDGDGRISRDEFLAGVAHAVLSDSPSDPGTGMLGQA